MKKLFLIGALLFSLMGCSQERKLSDVYHDFRLEAHIKDWEQQSHKHNIDKSKLYLLDSILILSHEEMLKRYPVPAWGLTVRDTLTDRRKIFMSSDIPNYLPTLMNAMFYHEMFHALAKDREHCKHIFGPYILRDGRYINIEEVIRTWDNEAKDRYFEYLKWNQDTQ